MADFKTDNYLLKYSDKFNIQNQEELVNNLDLDAVVIDKTGGCSGLIVDVNNEIIVNATVKIFDLNFNPIKHTVTDETGRFTITNCDQGDYLVYAVKDGYELSVKRTITIRNAIEILDDIVLKLFDVDTKGIVYGQIYDYNDKPLGDIKVNLYRSSDETLLFSTVSADDGEYVIYGISNDNYVLQASNEDYILEVPYNLSVDGNVPLNQDIFLKKINDYKEGTINGVITDKRTKAKIANAFVGLYRVDGATETLVAGTLTDFEGRYFFGCVPEGEYIVKSKAITNRLI